MDEVKTGQEAIDAAVKALENIGFKEREDFLRTAKTRRSTPDGYWVTVELYIPKYL